MNQIQKITQQPKLYIFDFDNTLIRHKPDCMDRVPAIAGQVIHGLTGLDPKEGARVAVASFMETGDGFAPYKNYPNNTYLTMHQQFNDAVNFVRTAHHDNRLPGLVANLSQHAAVCVASHCTQEYLETSMESLGYGMAGHVFGLERLKGFKSDPETRTFHHICDRYEVSLTEAFLVEDSQTNIENAENQGIGGSVLIDNNLGVADFIMGEIQKFKILRFQLRKLDKGAMACLPA